MNINLNKVEFNPVIKEMEMKGRSIKRFSQSKQKLKPRQGWEWHNKVSHWI